MLALGQIRARQCSGVTRRELLQIGSIGALGLNWPGLLRRQAEAAKPRRSQPSVILLWLWGGPSHLDTFDLKPAAPIEYRGPYSPIPTAVPGVEICELLPQLAQRADRYTILRSLNHSSNDHGISGTISLTGSKSGALSLGGKENPGRVQPTHGSIVARVRGNQPDIPSFVTIGKHLHQGKRRIRGEDGGPLGNQYDPFRVTYHEDDGVKIPQLELIDGLTAGTLASRRKLLAQIDELRRTADRSAAFDRMDSFYQQAFSLLTSGRAIEMFDLEKESDKLRRTYGRFAFGQSCLMARRLVGAGVPFVQVNWSSHVEPQEDSGDGGWDMHDRNFVQFQERHSWMLDQAVSALFDDLDDRGMLSNTIVMAIGEFGRTPKINGKTGRDHWNQCYSGLVAGGGLNCGQVIGASDRRGEYPATRPLSPADLATTVFEAIGIRTTDLTGIGLLPQGEVIEELV